MDKHKVSLREGKSLLERLLSEAVPVAHDCEGTLACASCAVQISEGMDELSPPNEDELDMLERAGADAPNMRLACQVGGAATLVVEIPQAETPVAGSAQAPLPVVVSAQAARFLLQQLAKHPGTAAVRLAVAPAGCSGFGYRVDPASEIRGDDKVFEAHGVRIVVDPASLPFVHGTRIDLVREGLARRLRYDNPNARQSCGCGESFGV